MNKRFIVIFAAVLASMISIATFNPIIGLLARSLGLSEVQSGSLVTVTGICWILGSFLWSRWGKGRRKTVMLIAMTGYVLTLTAFAYLADSAGLDSTDKTGLYLQLFAVRAIGGFFFGAIPATAQGYLMEWTRADNRAAGMALFGAANGLGFVLGPAMGAALTPIGLTAPMYVSAALLAVMLIVIAVSIPSGETSGTVAAAGKLSALDPRIRLYLGIGLALSTVMIVLQVTCGIYMQDRLDIDAVKAARLIGIGLTTAGVIVVASQLLIGRFRRLKPPILLTIGLLALCSAFTLFLASPSWYIVVFVLFGIGIGFTMPGYMTGASLAVDDGEQGALAAFTAAAQGVGSFIGPLAGTILYSLHIAIPYAVCAVLIVLFLAGTVFGRKGAKAGSTVHSR
ncbi:MFS transporter [Paenibacillus hodogayensis]|uniref:MFS transporter n=1 Tax=Paenibacillus hodogayensis TaxID=279208 RepID=A0ABV5W216_9BACL